MVKLQMSIGLLVFITVFLMSTCTDKKPKILIIGDSISIGYTPFVQEHFINKATIIHNEGNAQHTATGLSEIEKWLGNEPWDIIQFNWGLWDLCYRHPDSKEFGNRDKINGKPQFTIEKYTSNLDSIVTILKKNTKAKLIFVTTTYVPKNDPGRYETDVQKYNAAAIKVMKKHGVTVNDIYKPSIDIHKDNGLGKKDVHYNNKGYKKLSAIIIHYLETQIK